CLISPHEDTTDQISTITADRLNVILPILSKVHLNHVTHVLILHTFVCLISKKIVEIISDHFCTKQHSDTLSTSELTVKRTGRLIKMLAGDGAGKYTIYCFFEAHHGSHSFYFMQMLHLCSDLENTTCYMQVLIHQCEQLWPDLLWYMIHQCEQHPA
ncbi:hypothetical protein ACJX0J_020347, partial [Zea mays]